MGSERVLLSDRWMLLNSFQSVMQMERVRFFVQVCFRPVCLHMSRRLDIRRHNYQLMSRHNYQLMLWHFSAACPVSAKDVDEVEYFRPLIFCGRRRAGAALCGMQVNVQSDLPSSPSNSLTVGCIRGSARGAMRP